MGSERARIARGHHNLRTSGQQVVVHLGGEGDAVKAEAMEGLVEGHAVAIHVHVQHRAI